MKTVHIECDSAKNKLNIRKHGISFEEAQTVFFDPLTQVASDLYHSEKESRFLAIGYSSFHRLLIVVHCFYSNDEVVRIISARQVTRNEKKQYEEGL
ncbi:MAG: BrnT family toxin [Deltaproteobacteria bacterium]|nr:BrnT family toxin [Deltaproteobacteria bacterium]